MSSVFRIAKEKESPKVKGNSKNSSAVFKIMQKKTPSASDFEEKKLEEESSTEEENPFKKGIRDIARTGSDIASTVAGAPGDLLSLANEYIAGPIASQLTGEKAVPYEETPISKILPTGHKLRENTLEYLKPKTVDEETWSEFVQDVTTLGLPLPGGKVKASVKTIDWLKKAGTRLLKSAGLAGGALASKEIAEKMGVSPENAQKIKMGFLILGSIGGGGGFKGAEKYKDSLYADMRASRPSTVLVNANKLEQNALNLKTRFEKGGIAPSSTKSLEKVKEILSKIKKGKGKISLEELEEFGKKINEYKSGLYDEFKGNKTGRKSAKANLDSVTKIIEQGIEEYGKTNPEYASIRKMAQEAHGAIESSKKVSRFLQRNSAGLLKTGVGSILAEAIVNPSMIIPTLGGGLASLAGLKGAELTSRIIKSPVLREYYLNVIDGAMRRDAAFMNHNLKKIEKEVEEDPSILLKD